MILTWWPGQSTASPLRPTWSTSRRRRPHHEPAASVLTQGGVLLLYSIKKLNPKVMGSDGQLGGGGGGGGGLWAVAAQGNEQEISPYIGGVKAG